LLKASFPRSPHEFSVLRGHCPFSWFCGLVLCTCPRTLGALHFSLVGLSSLKKWNWSVLASLKRFLNTPLKVSMSRLRCVTQS
jgi:hypothetical protein